MPDSADTPQTPVNRCSVCSHHLPPEATVDGPCSACGHRVWFRKRDVGGLIVVDLMPQVNPETAEIDRVGQLLVGRRRAPRMLLNLAYVDFITSTFLNRLLILRRKMQDVRGRLLLCGLTPVIQEIFEVNKLGNLFDVFSNERDAIGES